MIEMHEITLNENLFFKVIDDYYGLSIRHQQQNNSNTSSITYTQKQCFDLDY
jgi:hypothetical protein